MNKLHPGDTTSVMQKNPVDIHLVGGFVQLEGLWHSVGGGGPLGVQDEDFCLPCPLGRLFGFGRFLQHRTFSALHPSATKVVLMQAILHCWVLRVMLCVVR